MDSIADQIICEEAIYSEEYFDYILEYFSSDEEILQKTRAVCTQNVDRYTSVGYVLRSGEDGNAQYLNEYQRIPKLYGLMDTSAVEALGVLRVRRQPYLNVFGNGVLMGIIDTGIDYTHPVFINADGTTRIASIWDQTIRDGTKPEGFAYGSLFTREQINEALRSERPQDVLPHTDTNGHGTFMAGVAAGNIVSAEDFTGVAPQCELVVVKLKQAKNNLKDYFCVEQGIEAYSGGDIMLATRFLLMEAQRLSKPIVIFLGMGSNSGRHCGCLPLPRYLSREAVKSGVAMVVSGGNEGNIGHHYERQMLGVEETDEFELKVGRDETGLSFEVWIDQPGLGSIELVSPLGETTDLIPLTLSGSRPIRFPLERTQIYVKYNLVEPNARSELIFVRLLEPTPGIWRVRVKNEVNFVTSFNSWLPIRNFVKEGTYFLNPEPNVTICEPGNASLLMTITAYDNYNDSIYLQASRGFARNEYIKPDFAAPGVNVFGPLPRGLYGRMTGTSVAAALAAGCAALMLEWGVVQQNDMDMNTIQISNFFMRSARRKDIVYPNREWGYGEIDLYNTFSEIRVTN